jgi:hypothetical protein
VGNLTGVIIVHPAGNSDIFMFTGISDWYCYYPPYVILQEGSDWCNDSCYIENIAVFTFAGEPDESLLSNSSSEQPDWRIKYHGDYKGTTMPVCSQDLFCWAFQVASGMEYLASRKVRRIITASNIITGNLVFLTFLIYPRIGDFKSPGILELAF